VNGEKKNPRCADSTALPAKTGLQDFVRKLVEGDPDEAKLLMDMLDAWKSLHDKFGAIAEFAWSRTSPLRWNW
jgi:hypothetical protein